MEIHHAVFSTTDKSQPRVKSETPFEQDLIKSIEMTTGKKVGYQERLMAALSTNDVPATIGMARKLVRKKRKGKRTISEGSVTFVDGYFEDGELNIDETDEVFEKPRGLKRTRSSSKVVLKLILTLYTLLLLTLYILLT